MPPKAATTRSGFLGHVKRLAIAAHAQIKEAKIISKTLNKAGHTNAGAIAGMLGYGKRKRRVKRKAPKRRR